MINLDVRLEGTKRATSINVQRLRLRKGLRASSISRDTEFPIAEGDFHGSRTFCDGTEVACSRKSHVRCCLIGIWLILRLPSAHPGKLQNVTGGLRAIGTHLQPP